VCQRLRYGVSCGQRCECEEDAPCDRVSGACLCPQGTTGKRCEKGEYHVRIPVMHCATMLFGVLQVLVALIHVIIAFTMVRVKPRLVYVCVKLDGLDNIVKEVRDKLV